MSEKRGLPGKAGGLCRPPFPIFVNKYKTSGLRPATTNHSVPAFLQPGLAREIYGSQSEACPAGSSLGRGWNASRWGSLSLHRIPPPPLKSSERLFRKVTLPESPQSPGCLWEEPSLGKLGRGGGQGKVSHASGEGGGYSRQRRALQGRSTHFRHIIFCLAGGSSVKVVWVNTSLRGVIWHFD